MRLKPRRCLIPELLVKRNWTQRRLADHSGIDAKLISKYATFKQKEMPLSANAPLADALGVTDFYTTYINARARRIVNVFIASR